MCRPLKAVNVNCADHYAAAFEDADNNGHSWYFGDAIFLADLAQTLAGDKDRRVIGERRSNAQGELQLL